MLKSKNGETQPRDTSVDKFKNTGSKTLVLIENLSPRVYKWIQSAFYVWNVVGDDIALTSRVLYFS